MRIICEVATGTEYNFTWALACGVLNVSSVNTPFSVKFALPFLHEDKELAKTVKSKVRNRTRFMAACIIQRRRYKTIVENKYD